MDWLDRLREKPEHVRFRIALLAAGVITAIIFIVWFSVLTFSPNERAVKEASRGSGPVSDFRASFSEFLHTSGEQFSEFFDGFGTIQYEAKENLSE